MVGHRCTPPPRSLLSRKRLLWDIKPHESVLRYVPHWVEELSLSWEWAWLAEGYGGRNLSTIAWAGFLERIKLESSQLSNDPSIARELKQNDWSCEWGQLARPQHAPSPEGVHNSLSVEINKRMEALLRCITLPLHRSELVAPLT